MLQVMQMSGQDLDYFKFKKKKKIQKKHAEHQFFHTVKQHHPIS